MSRRQRRDKPSGCYFCGRRGDLTEEHAWPRWLGKGALVEPTQSTRRIGFDRSSVDTYRELPTEVTNKQGSVLTTRLREVCRTCNGGWMSRLEQQVAPVFERMCSTDYPLGFTALEAEQVRIVAAWAVKTAWVRERIGSPRITPTREQFVDAQRPPEFTKVWAGRHEGLSNFGVYVLEVEAHHRDRPLDGRESRHVLVCSLTFRGLSLLVRTDDGWGVPQMAPPADRWIQLWPSAGTIVWPPRSPVTDNDVQDVVAGFSAWMPLPDLPNFIREAE